MIFKRFVGEVPWDEWPEYLWQIERKHGHIIKGIYAGGCCLGEEYTKKNGPARHLNIWAHAHDNRKYPEYGWICLHKKGAIKHRLLMCHEVAHIMTLTYEPVHGEVWQQNCLALGGTIRPYCVGFDWKNLAPIYTPDRRLKENQGK